MALHVGRAVIAQIYDFGIWIFGLETSILVS